jgi:glucose-6-phosphate isomerase
MAAAPPATPIWETPEWAALAAHAATAAPAFHLPSLLQQRTLQATFDTWTLDYSRQLVTQETLALLQALAARAELPARIAAMTAGARLNTTEQRSVLHTALRCGAEDALVVEGVDVCAEVRAVQARIQDFAGAVRSGALRGASGKPLRSIVSIGIGGSYLGVEFAYEALRHDAAAKAQAEGFTLRFLANVDPTDAARALQVRARRGC